MTASLFTQAIPCSPEIAAALTGNTPDAVRAEYGDMVWVDISIRGPIGMRPGLPDPEQQRRDIAEIFTGALRHVRAGSVGPVDWAAAAAKIGAQPEPCANDPMLLSEPSCPRCAFERSAMQTAFGPIDLVVHPGVPQGAIHIGDRHTGAGVQIRNIGDDDG
ncbi:hypothetical protein ACRYCC_26195 [Actinomadura scrupuli]|uniref:hypothetical protein n=1 Tax=Actinomadura scrupuli TaxID=559629 RepID=UPI003D982DCE